jgi:RNase P subunit RPR2
MGCTNEAAADAETETTATKVAPEEKKELEMYEASELAALMRKMYEGNLTVREQILAGELPESFPEEFKTIHTAQATNPEELDATFKALAKEYIKNMETITAASNKGEATLAYNQMIGTCASCHQIYCQGPLAKINKMRIKSIVPQ